MEMRFVCSCGKKLKADTQYAGRTVRCPKCRQLVTVPAPGEAGDIPLTPPPTGEPLTARPKPPPPPPAASPMPPPAFPTHAATQPATSGLTLHDLRDPGEQTARVVLILFATPVWLVLIGLVVMSLGGFLLLIGFMALTGYMAKLFMLAYIKTNAVETSPAQFPQIDRAAQDLCARLEIEKPHIYVMQENVWNAFAAKLAGRRIVVLLSGAVDSILLKGDMKQVAWLVGHEIGHHLAGHVGLFHTLLRMGGWFPWVLLWHSRRAELTCDNVALYAAGIEASLKAVANATVGAQLASELNTEEALRQWETHRREFFVRYRTIHSTHPAHLWRMDNLLRTAHRLGLAA